MPQAKLTANRMTGESFPARTLLTDVERVTANGLTALRVAEAAGHKEIAEFLLARSADGSLG